VARSRRSDAATVKALKIISGGQTGVDRAALDVALKHGIDCGGWCPAGRLDEFGRIPEQYPVRELQEGGFRERTLQNVKDSDGTVVIYSGEIGGGTEQTVRFCVELKQPYELIDGSTISTQDGAKLIANFVRKNKIGILNVAGPRQSEWPEGYDYACRALDHYLNSITCRSRSTSKSRCRSRSKRQSYS
jgi:Circularly permutated YpsA SLOG family